jgi:hypothetical protein
MVSSIRFLPSWRALRCNGGAILVVLAFTSTTTAQTPNEAQPDSHPIGNSVKFLAGAGGAFVLHESAHLVADSIFGAEVRVIGVHFGPVPFFAVSHEGAISPREEVVISSAGLWTQYATAEWLLTKHPDLRHEHAPAMKGIFAFDILTAVGYGTVALFKAGPVERDTLGMTATGFDERAVGVFVIAPAAFDAWRYFHPEARWAVWAARAAKVATVVLVVKGQ